MPVTLVLRRLRADGKEKDLPKRKQDKTTKSHNSSISHFLRREFTWQGKPPRPRMNAARTCLGQ